MSFDFDPSGGGIPSLPEFDNIDRQDPGEVAGRAKIRLDYDLCEDTGVCAQVCPVDSIEYRPHERHAIDVETCTRCNMCFEVCQDRAVEIVSGDEICATSPVAPQTVS